MRPSMFLAAQPLPRAEFVGAVFQTLDTSPASTLLDIAGAGGAANLFCMVFYSSLAAPGYPSLTGGSAGWSQDNYTWTPNYGYKASTFHKRLTALDISEGVRIVTPNAGGASPEVVIAIYRRVSSAVRKALKYEDDAGAAHSTPGYVKGVRTVGTVAFLVDRDVSGVNVAASVSGGALVERLEEGPNSALGFRHALFDALGEDDYPDGAAVSWSGLGSTYAEVSQLYELRV